MINIMTNKRERRMIKNPLVFILTLLSLVSPLRALDGIDKFVNNHCENRCNGERSDCWRCYSQGVDLWRHPFTDPKDLDDDDDDDDPYGNVGYEVGPRGKSWVV